MQFRKLIDFLKVNALGRPWAHWWRSGWEGEPPVEETGDISVCWLHTGPSWQWWELVRTVWVKVDLWGPHPARTSSGAAGTASWVPRCSVGGEQQLFVANSLLQKGLHPTPGFPDLRANACLLFHEDLSSYHTRFPHGHKLPQAPHAFPWKLSLSPEFSLGQVLTHKTRFHLPHSPPCSLTVFQSVHNLLKMRCSERRPCVIWLAERSGRALPVWDPDSVKRAEACRALFWQPRSTAVSMSWLCGQCSPGMLPLSCTYGVWTSTGLFYMLLAFCSSLIKVSPFPTWNIFQIWFILTSSLLFLFQIRKWITMTLISLSKISN